MFSSTWGNPEVGGGDSFWGSYNSNDSNNNDNNHHHNDSNSNSNSNDNNNNDDNNSMITFGVPNYRQDWTNKYK